MEIAKIKKLISKNELGEAISRLLSLTDGSPVDNEIIQIQKRLYSIKQDRRGGIISDHEFILEENKVSSSLLDFINSYDFSSQTTSQNNKVIVGLRTYTQNDNDTFKHLQRQQEIEMICDALLNGDFYWNILNGSSGSGKTSFLQAGVIPKLEKKGAVSFYIKFSNIPPLESIIEPITKPVLNKPPLNLKEIFFTLQGQYPKKLIILIFDQFEQFFTSNRLSDDRRELILNLKEWYESRKEFNIKLIISIRSDFLHYLYEIQDELRYPVWARQNYFNLEKFTPTQATLIFQYIAEKEQVDFDFSFIKQMCREELANKEDGLISAVEIQILSMMLEAQRSSYSFAFNRKAYEKFGGIEGLLLRYLKEQLDSRTTQNKNQISLKLLLALTDLESNVRVGQLTSEELKNKLNGVVDASKIEPTLKWLERARLISKIEKEKQETTYELGHERMIIPLRNLAGKTLSEIDQLSTLLDRRVNEWLGNEKKSRYLLISGRYGN